MYYFNNDITTDLFNILKNVAEDQYQITILILNGITDIILEILKDKQGLYPTKTTLVAVSSLLGNVRFKYARLSSISSKIFALSFQRNFCNIWFTYLITKSEVRFSLENDKASQVLIFEIISLLQLYLIDTPSAKAFVY